MLNNNFILDESNSYHIRHSSPLSKTEIKNKRKIKNSEDETSDGNLFLIIIKHIFFLRCNTFYIIFTLDIMYNNNLNLNESSNSFQMLYSSPLQITVLKSKIKNKYSKDATIDSEFNF